MMPSPAPERLLDLLVARATQGLSEPEAREMHVLIHDHPGFDEDRFELAAAAVDLAMLHEVDAMPAALRTRLHHLADRHVLPHSEADNGHLPASAGGRSKRHPLSRERMGWWLAAAAVVVAALGWWQALQPGSEPSTAASRNAMLQSERELLSAAWQATEDPAARRAGGDVIWSSVRQTGYMRIVGLEPNDPTLFQYQLWVFDLARDERYPVDGGVFDIPADESEVIVAIRASVPVDTPTLFAVTAEKPGGVVVSKRERVVLLAQPQRTGD